MKKHWTKAVAILAIFVLMVSLLPVHAFANPAEAPVVEVPTVDVPVAGPEPTVDDEPVVEDEPIVVDEPVVDDDTTVDDEPLVVDEPSADDELVDDELVDDGPIVDEELVTDEEALDDEDEDEDLEEIAGLVAPLGALVPPMVFATEYKVSWMSFNNSGNWNSMNGVGYTVEAGKTSTLSSNPPSRSGYEWIGWSTVPHGPLEFTGKESGKYVGKNGSESPVITGNVIFYAVYRYTGNQGPKQYLVTFKDWNGDVLGYDLVDSGTAATAPDAPEREGYTFTSWDKPFNNITSALTVTAQYEINTYTVSFYDHNNTLLKELELTVEYGKDVEKLPDGPTHEGWIFKGWSHTVAQLTNVTDDVIVTAICETTVTWMNGDALLKTDAAKYGDMPEYTDATPTKAGDAENYYEFTGWTPTIVEVTEPATYTATYNTVAKTKITIAYPSNSKEYDGESLEPKAIDASNVTGTLNEGDKITAWTGNTEVTRIDAGMTGELEVTGVTIMNGEEDVTYKYAITYVKGTLEVTPRPINLVANSVNESYTGSEITVGSVDEWDYAQDSKEFVGGSDSLTGLATTGAGTDVDEYDITFTGESITLASKEMTISAEGTELEGNGNYIITLKPGVLKIVEADFDVNTLKFDAESGNYTKVYGEKDPAYGIIGWPGGVSLDDFTITFKREKVDGVNKEYKHVYSEGENVGSYTVTATITSDNYNLERDQKLAEPLILVATLEITQATLTPVIASPMEIAWNAEAPSYTYTDDNELPLSNFSYSFTGYKFDDTDEGVFVGDSRGVVGIVDDENNTYAKGDPAGTYDVELTGVSTQNENYMLNTATGILNVRPVEGISWDKVYTLDDLLGSDGKVYGEPEPSAEVFENLFKWASEDGLGFDLEDYFTLKSVQRVAGEDVNQYVISANVTVNENYKDTFQFTGEEKPTSVFEITPRSVYIAPSDTGKVAGTSDPALAATVQQGVQGDGFGLLPDDSLSTDKNKAAYTLARDAGETVGDYYIWATMDEDVWNRNYEFTSEPGTFTITPVPTWSYTVVYSTGAAQYLGGAEVGRTGGTVPAGGGDIAPDLNAFQPAGYGAGVLANGSRINGDGEVKYVVYTALPGAAPVDAPEDAPEDTPEEGPAGDETEELEQPQTPLAGPEDDETDADSEPIDERDIPQAGPQAAAGWALLNLLIAVLSLVFGFALVVTAISRKKKGGKGWRVLSVLAGVAAPIAFFLTENILNPMIFADMWTLLMVAILAVQVLGMALLKRAQGKEDETENAKA